MCPFWECKFTTPLLLIRVWALSTFKVQLFFLSPNGSILFPIRRTDLISSHTLSHPLFFSTKWTLCLSRLLLPLSSFMHPSPHAWNNLLIHQISVLKSFLKSHCSQWSLPEITHPLTCPIYGLNPSDKLLWGSNLKCFCYYTTRRFTIYLPTKRMWVLTNLTL